MRESWHSDDYLTCSMNPRLSQRLNAMKSCDCYVVSGLRAARLWCLFYLALVAVEPVKGFLDHLIAGRNVPRFEDGMAFVPFRHAKRLEHHILRGVREKLIVAAVDHQSGHRHPWCEIDFIDFGKFLVTIKTSTEEHKHFDAFVDRRKNVSEVRACT
jgi:hypothetical protein